MARSDTTQVAVVGGSIAGCSAAIAAQRAGCDVTIFERSSGRLTDRGSAVPPHPSQRYTETPRVTPC